MKKQLTIVAALMFAVACKTDSPSKASSAAAGDDSNAKARSAKIEVKPLQPPAEAPALPAQPEQPAPPAEPPAEGEPPRVIEPPAADPAARGEWRQRRDVRLDKDGDGVITPEERQAARTDRMENMRTRLDTNGDGKLSPDELAERGRGRMRFDDPAALDTNHDGDISQDELAEGFRARREQGRGARGSAAGAQGTPGATTP
jgi:hypothetical protein